jgi:hypothetical protein
MSEHAYGDTDAVIDPGSVFLADIPGWEDQGPRPTAADQGIRTNSGILHFLQHVFEDIEEHAGFQDHKQQNAIMSAIIKNLAPEPNVVPTREKAAETFETGIVAVQQAGNAAKLLGARDKRRSLVLYNNGANTVYIDRWQGANIAGSFPLSAGGLIVFPPTQSEIWFTAAAIPATIAFIETFDN